MSDGLGFVIVGIIAAFTGFLIGIDTTRDGHRDTFLKYCTSHGDTFEACDKIWRGTKP